MTVHLNNMCLGGIDGGHGRYTAQATLPEAKAVDSTGRSQRSEDPMAQAIRDTCF